MDQAGDSYGGQGAAEGKTGASIGGDSMTAPLPPVFGNANTNRIGGEGDFRGINLDDIFSGVFFTPDGELLDFSSDDDDGHNVTFSSTSAVEGCTHPPFAQYAVLGDSPDATGGGDDSGHAEGVFMSPSRVKRRKIPKIQHGGESGSTGESANPGLFEVPGGIGVGGALGGGVEIEMGATRAAEGTAGVLTVQPKPEYPPEGRCSAAEATGGTAGAATEAATAAAAAAGKARAAQDAAVSRAAAKAAEAAEAHAQAQTRAQAAGAATAENPSPYARPAASNPLAALPTGGIMGPLATHGFRSTSLPLQGIGALGRGEGAARGIRGITAVAPPNASLLAGGPRGRGVYAGGVLPRRQRHKVSSKDLTEEQRNERRERNREHAKRSRVRKKFLLDSLQRSVDALQAENDSLKGSIVGSLGERGRELVAKFSPEDEGGTLVTANPTQATKILDDPDYSLVKALQTAQQNFVITDASLADNPIVFASSGFLELTRYTLTEVLGRNCRFLQGPETDPRAVDKIRMAIEEGCDTSVCLLNYRADGTTFWNQFFVAALRDGEGATVNYVGVQCKVGDDYARKVVAAQKKQIASLRAGPAAAAAAEPSRGVQPSRSQPSSNQTAPGTAPASAAAAPSAAAGAGARNDGTQI